MMTNKSIITKFIIVFLLLSGYVLNNQVYAQNEVILGAFSKKGNSNTTITKGEGIGMKMNAGKKRLTIKSLNMDLISTHPDSVKFYIRLFPIKGKILGKNIMQDKVYSQSLRDNRINIDLSDLNISVAGKFVVGLEWAESATGSENKISFHAGLLKKGVYYKDDEDNRWKKVPLLGFNMQLRGVEN